MSVEFVTDAVILDIIPVQEADARVTLYTKDFGKITAKTTSLRKITSKSAGHLQPGSLAIVRIFDKNGPQLIDAVSKKRRPLSGKLVAFFSLLNSLLGEGDQDLTLWTMLVDIINGKAEPSNHIALGHLGFDPRFARCGHCGNSSIAVFSTIDTQFYCEACVRATTQLFYVYS